MAAHSKPSRKKEKPSTKKTEKSTTPAEAAELLASALEYCNEADLTVEGYNESDGLVLFVRGAQFSDGQIVIVDAPQEVTPIGVTMVTPVEQVTP